MKASQLVIVLSHSLEQDYPSKAKELAVLKEIQKALRRRSYVSLLKGGARELFKVYNEFTRS